MSQESAVNFQALFETGQPLYLILLPDAPKYTIAGASDAYLDATKRTREELTGMGIFEAFPGNPDDPDAKSEEGIRGSIERAIATGFPDSLPFLKYDVPRPESEGGGYEVKYWSVSHSPIFDREGELVNVAQKCEDVTEFVLLQQKGVEASTMNEQLRNQVGQLELATMARAQEIKDSNTKLIGANTELNKQRTELQGLYDRLQELDRAKTQFFANISHEFRTPLTLMLAPLEDMLSGARGRLEPEFQNDVDLIYRNAARLLKLVNALLDFARFEAGRAKASFKLTDISGVTRELASSFTSLIEGAKIKYTIKIDQITADVYVDVEMWEKIVLNLISNAFKFTLRGEITVKLHLVDDNVHLSVSDSGCGIAANELPKIFERFHRVEGAKGRSFEGTGIGLSLISEFSKLHGGTVTAQSEEGKGTKFTVSIPVGLSHLPLPDISDAKPDRPSARAAGSSSYLLEASHWSASDELGSVPPIKSDLAPVGSEDPLKSEGKARILIVDDSSDMREYLSRTLGDRWEVSIAHDGIMALDEINKQAPDLVLSDVMMPKLDGIGLLKQLRSHKLTAEIPLILLSARAGEESLLEGIETGADDYITKPFSRKELLARVQTHLNMAKIRRKLLLELENANKELESFSYSVSHDLRAPLRAIDGFSKMLLEKHSSSLNDEGQRYLERVRVGSQKMGLLIDDLLDLSRLSKLPVNRKAVNVSELTNKVIKELQAAEPDRNVSVSIEKSLNIIADERLTEILLTNLLSNAWKFTAKQPNASIEVGVKSLKDGQALFVKDNGAGFDMTYAHKLFTPFQRLHSQDEFVGTGIGLATVYRVVSRHGGKIWAEGEVNKGATFYFNLGDKNGRAED